jgi:hypothetical protein
LALGPAFEFFDRYALRYESKDLVLETVEPSASGQIHQYRTYFSNGEGRVEDPLTLTVACESEVCYALGLADVDGDGDADLVVGQTESLGPAGYRHRVAVHRALDAGGFAATAQVWHRHTADSADPPDVIGLADVNGDLKSDLVIHEHRQIDWYNSRSLVQVYLSNGRDSFEAQHQEWAALDYHYYLEVDIGLGDYDRDGRADLIYSQRYVWFPAPVQYYLSRSTGTGFEGPLSPAAVVVASFSGSPLHFLNAADADGDGFADLVLGGEVFSPAVETPVFVGLASGSASPVRFFGEQNWSNLPLQTGDEIAAVSDVDADGAADLILKIAGQPPQIQVWMSNGWDQFEESGHEWVDAATILPASDFQIVGVADIGLGSWQ